MYQIRLSYSLLVCLAAFLSSEFGIVTTPTSLPTAAKPTTADFFSSFRAVRVSGDRANVGEPSAPRLESKIRTRPSRLSYAVEIHVAGGIAYVADGLDGVSVFSIKGGAAPEFLRTIDTPDFANGVWVDDTGKVSVADRSSYQVYAVSP